MTITLVRGFGKCIDCGKMTSIQLWLGKMQFFYCKDCAAELSKDIVQFLEKETKKQNITEGPTEQDFISAMSEIMELDNGGILNQDEVMRTLKTYFSKDTQMNK